MHGCVKRFVLVSALFIVGIVAIVGVGVGSAVGAQRADDAASVRDTLRSMNAEAALAKEQSNQRLEAQEKRISDLGLAAAQQANYLSAISNQTASLANYIALTSAFIGIVVFLAGSFSYWSATRRASQEANAAAEKWFQDNAVQHVDQLAALRVEVDEALAEIRLLRSNVKSTADQTNREMVEYGRQILATPIAGAAISGFRSTATVAVREASDVLMTKAEADFTASDYLTRGLAEFSEKRFDSALRMFENGSMKIANPAAERDLVSRLRFAKGVALGRLDRPVEAIAVFREMRDEFDQASSMLVHEQTATAMVNEARLLGKLDRHEEAIGVFDAVGARFRPDISETINALLPLARNGAGFGRLLLAKVRWASERERDDLLARAIGDLNVANGVPTSSDLKPSVLGNLGYALFLRDGADEHAVKATLACLQFGGRKALDVQHKDAARHRLDPEDTLYEAMLERVWRELHPGH